MIQPKSIAVIGASSRPNSMGYRIFENIVAGGFNGKLYPINPKYFRVQKHTCYASITDINAAIDLAIIATSEKHIPNIIVECGKKDIAHVIILSTGFSEQNEIGKYLEQHIFNIARGYHIRLLGPNSLGVMRPHAKLNAMYDCAMAQPGNLAFVSQSAAVSAGIIKWSKKQKIGFSAIISLGNSVDIDFSDILDFLATDKNTQSILLYIEHIKHARRFMSALRAAARLKPVIVIKTGRSQTNSLNNPFNDEVFDIALKRAGALRVMSIEDLFIAAEILSSHRVTGKKLAIITNGPGLGNMAADFAADLDIPLANISETSKSKLNNLLSTQIHSYNPLDVVNESFQKNYAEILNIYNQDPNINGAIIVSTKKSAMLSFDYQNNIFNIPILGCCLNEKRILDEFSTKPHFPTFDTPDKAVKAFSYLANYHQNQELLLQVPEPLSMQSSPDLRIVRDILDKAKKEIRETLTNEESFKILSAFAIPVGDQSFNHSRKLTLSVFRDPLFGPIINFGAGGALYELLKDRALALPPLNHFIAKQLIEQTSIAKLLGEYNNMPAVNLDLIIHVLLRLSEMVCELPEIMQINIDPLLANDQAVAVSNVVIMIDPHFLKNTSAYAHMAIHPYPHELIAPVELKSGQQILVRPIRPEDAYLAQEFVRSLSMDTKYFRFMHHLHELTPVALLRLTQIDYDREMTFIATSNHEGKEICIGVSHYITNPDGESCEFALAVSDAWQKKGVGFSLMKKLISKAKYQDLRAMHGEVLATNTSMLNFTKRLGFKVSNNQEPTIKTITKVLI